MQVETVTEEDANKLVRIPTRILLSNSSIDICIFLHKMTDL